MSKTIYEQMEEIKAKLELEDSGGVGVIEENTIEEETEEDGDLNVSDTMESEDEAETTEAEPAENNEEAPKEKTKEETDASLAWKIRQENKRLKEQLELVELERERLKKMTALSEPEPDKEYDPEAWAKWKADRIVNERDQARIDQDIQSKQNKSQEDAQREAAINGFLNLENQFKSMVPDYEQVATAYTENLKKSLQTLYPYASQEQIEHEALAQILRNADNNVRQGKNPAQELYNLGKMYYTKPEEDKIPVKPDLKKVEQNKKRSASLGATGGGSSSVSVSVDQISSMTTEQFGKLSAADIARLESELLG